MASPKFIKFFFGNKTHPALTDWPEKPMWNQVHGVRSARVLHPNQNVGDADALWTLLPDFKIGVRAADCVPVLLAWSDPINQKVKAVAAIHSGWKGTLGRILESFFAETAVELPGAENWKVWIGPSIRACCYEVGSDLISQFVEEFSEVPHAIIEPKNRHLDLVALCLEEFKRLGVKHIDVHPDCTFCSNHYFSYRKGDRNARQYSIISFSNQLE